MANSDGFWKAISLHESFLITAHVRPDLDSVGSEIALSLFLAKLGKQTRIVNESPFPVAFAFLPHSDDVRTYPDGMDFEYAAVICLDSPELSRTGRVGENLGGAPIYIVDHHPYTNSMVDFAWIDPQCSSTGELLYRFINQHGSYMDADIATCLYAAIMADTGRFTYANTTGDTLAAVAQLVLNGAQPAKIAQEYYENVTDGQMYLLGRATSGVHRACGGEVAYTSLTREDFDKAGTRPEEAQELAEIPRLLVGVKVGVLLRELDGRTKVSLRSKGGTDVKTVAEHFGGGGHREASGFFVELPLAEAEIEVIRFLEEYLENRRG